MKAFLFLLVSYCFINNCSAQEDYKKKVDSLLIMVQKPQADTTKIATYLVISRAYLSFDINKSNEYCEKVILLSKKVNNQKGIRYYYGLKAKILIAKGKPNEALVYADTAIVLYDKAKKDKGYFSALYSKAFSLVAINEFKEAEHVVTFAIEELLQTKYPKRGDFYLLLGSIHSREMKYHTALLYFKTAIEEYRKSKNNAGINNCYIEMCNIYIKINQLPMAMNYINLCFSSLSQNKTITKQSEAIFYIKKGELLNKMNKYSEALVFLEKSLKINLEIGNKSFIANNWYQFAEAYSGLKNFKKTIASCEAGLICNDATAAIDLNYMLGKTYFNLGNYNNAKTYQLKALAQINAKKFIQNEVSKGLIYESLAKTEYKLGNFKKAYLYHDFYTEFEKLMLINERENKIAEILIQFDVHEKDMAFKNLTIANQKKEIVLQQQNYYLKIVSFGMLAAFLLLIIGLIGFQIYRKKKLLLAQQNQIIAEKNESLQLTQNLLQKSLTEKEILLKEIHHRVKNNLQLIMSLLNIQARQNEIGSLQQEDSTIITDFIQKGQSRISAMALIHQNLYQTENFERIDFQVYLENLVENIKKSYSENENIKFVIQANGIFFNIVTATPLGLIINELVSNALKHAFPNNISGTVFISFLKIESNIEINVSDTGIGIKNSPCSQKTLGLELVRLLVSQIKGDLSQEEAKGTNYKIVFKN